MKKFAVKAAVLLLLASLLTGCNKYKNPTASPLKTQGTRLYPSGQTIGPSPSATATPALQSLMPSPPAVTPQNPETPAPTLKATTGNIPAAQSFVSYSSADGHYDVQYPEGWTPEVLDGDARFTHNYDGLSVQVAQATESFTLDAITKTQVANLIRTGRAVAVKKISSVTTKSGNAVLVEYDSNSEPLNGKKVRLSSQIYYYYNSGRLAALTMWAPLGSNNANIWKQLPDTFVWR